MRKRIKSILFFQTISGSVSFFRNIGYHFLRVLKRNALFTSVNIIGLFIGISAFILLSLRVYNAVTFEDFNSNADKTYRILTEPEGEQRTILSVCRLSEELRGFPQIVNSCRITPYFVNLTVKNSEIAFREPRIIAADTNFFSFFSYHLSSGNARSVLQGPDKIVLSESMKKKYFGSVDPVGESVTILFGNSSREMEITGVFSDLPAKTNLNFDFVISNIDGIGKIRKDDPWFNWELLNWITYIQLAPEVNADIFESLISDRLIKRDPSSKYYLHLQSLKRIHLHSGDLANAEMLTKPGNIRHVRLMSLIAILILFIACMNFIILTCADSLSRTREIVIRKIFGSSEIALVKKFLLEMSFFIIIALCFSLITIPLIVTALGDFSGQDFRIAGVDLRLVISLLLVLSAINLITGSYPAFYLAKNNSLSNIPGRNTTGKKGFPLLNLLLALQLTVSLVLIFSTITLTRQIKLIRKFDLGFDTENIIYFSCDEIPYDYRTGISVLRDALMGIPSVENVTCGSELPLSINNYMDEADWDGKTPENKSRFHYLKAEHSFLRTFNIRLLKGRDFSREITSDDSSFLINEAAARVLDYENPLGKNFTYIFRGTDKITGKIVGITEDFHFNTLYNKTEPLVIGIQVGKPRYIFVRFSPGTGPDCIAEIRRVVKNIYPTTDPDIELLGQTYIRQYIQEIQTGRIFSIFCFIALLITMLGLFGQSAFTLEKRKLEFSIRKINGATVLEIMKMLSREYLALFVSAFLIAVPIAYFTMSEWLQYFAYKTRIDAAVLMTTALAGVIMIFIAVIGQLYLQASKTIMDTIRSN